jgi:hypothetical protein
VSAPTLAARNLKAPVPFTVPATTVAPAILRTGTGSPVIIASSTKDEPSITAPSTAILSPGRTMMTSPGRIASTGTSSSPPSRTTRAVFGCNVRRRRMASLALPFALASRKRPNRTRVTITALASK